MEEQKWPNGIATNLIEAHASLRINLCFTALNYFYHGANVSRAMVFWPPFKEVTHWPSNLTDKNKHVCKVCNWSRVLDCHMIVSWLSHDCLMTVLWLSYDCLMTVLWLSHDCVIYLMAVSWRKRNYLGFGGPWVCAVLALVFSNLKTYWP